MNRRNLRHFGLPEEDLPEKQVGDTVAIFEDHLEALLECEWPQWRTVCVAHEATTGEIISKNHAIYRMVARKVETDPPEQLTKIISKVLALTEVYSSLTFSPLFGARK